MSARPKATSEDTTRARASALETHPAVRSRANRGVHENKVRWPLVADRHFILATRDTGYRSTPAAVSELIDNALQAGAGTVHVLVREDRRDLHTPGVSSRRVSLAVLDDGLGMNAAVLRRALQFGGSERFNDRSGLGRFGMGLPNSSVSQSRRLELYSWRNGERPLYSYLDVREIARGTMCEIPRPRPCLLPEWVRASIESTGHAVPTSGTLVLWPECDRLPYRKASTIRAKLYAALGRTYRYPLRKSVRLMVDGHLVEPVDPLMEWGSIAETYGVATQYGDELSYEFKVPGAPSQTSVVRVRFTALPVHRFARLPVEVRRELGIIGGGGVSIVRAGREVDFGWHLMGGKRRENYDDWWRCEVHFEPELDEYFGVTHSKQGITPHPILQDALSADLEQIARALNVRIRNEFLHLGANGVVRTIDEREPRSVPDILSAFADAAPRVAQEQERFLPPPDHRIRRFRIAHASLNTARFFVAKLERGELVLTLNSEHPLCKSVSRLDANSRGLFDIVLLAAARAEVVVRTGENTPLRSNVDGGVDVLEHFLETWSDTLAAYLSRA